MLIEPFPGTWGCAERSALFSHLSPMTAHLIDEATEMQTGEITFPSYQLVSGRVRFQRQIVFANSKFMVTS